MSKKLFFNWKMNPASQEESSTLFQELAKALKLNPQTEAVVCPPTIFLPALLDIRSKQGLGCGLGSQDVSAKQSGSLTGEVSATMLAKVGIEYAIIGHSETRSLHRLSDEDVNQKVQAAIEAGLQPIVCIGFQADPDSTEINYAELAEQIEVGLRHIETSQNLIYLAYEPVWAIGSGKSADADTVTRVVDFIEEKLKEMGLSNGVEILYGGSVDDKSIDSLLQLGKVAGFLVGGASLKPEKFSVMIEKVAK